MADPRKLIPNRLSKCDDNESNECLDFVDNGHESSILCTQKDNGESSLTSAENSHISPMQIGAAGSEGATGSSVQNSLDLGRSSSVNSPQENVINLALYRHSQLPNRTNTMIFMRNASQNRLTTIEHNSPRSQTVLIEGRDSGWSSGVPPSTRSMPEDEQTNENTR